jgi:O-antigen ligase
MRNLTYWLSLLFIFVVPWENIIMFGSGSETLGKFIGLAVAGLWLLTVIATDRVRIPLPLHLATFLFDCWNIVSLLWSAEPDRTFERAQTYAQLGILIFMLWDIYCEPRMLSAAIQAYVFGAFITAGSTLYNYLNASAYYYNRYAASGFNPNDAGLILGLGIPFAWHLATYTGKHGVPLLFRIINFLYLPAALYAIFLTGSRGTLVAASVSFLFILATVTQLQIRTQLLLLTGSVVALVAVFLVIPPTSIARIAEKGVALNGREDVWSQSFEVMLNHPWLGVGSGAVKTVIEAQQSAHNFALAIGAELGVIGLLLFGSVLALTFYHAWRQPGRYRYLWLTVLLIWFLGASVHNWEHRKQTWLLFSLVVISGSVRPIAPVPAPIARPHPQLTEAGAEAL